MIERIHPVVSVESKLVGITVPALPDTGRTLCDRIQPGSVLRRLKKLIGNVVQAMVRKCIQHVSGRIEACRDRICRNIQPIAVRDTRIGDRSGIVLEGFLQILLADHAKTKRCRIGSLRVDDLSVGLACLAGLGVDKVFIPCFSCRLSDRTILFRLVCITHSISHNSSLVEASDIHSVSKHHTVGRNTCKVVAQCSCLAGQALFLLLLTIRILVAHRCLCQMIHICINILNVILYDTQVSGLQVQIVRDRHNQAVPGDTKALPVVWDHIVRFQIISDKRRAVL